VSEPLLVVATGYESDFLEVTHIVRQADWAVY
jgi:hypothetical protein